MEPKVSERLLSIAGLVPKGSVVCDIGCDHALLPIYLIKNNIAKSAIAMDVVEGPLKGARENIKRFGLEDKIEVRLSDGFDSLRIGEANCVVIAGMGGNLMLKLLLQGKSIWQECDSIILSPHRDDILIREYMSECSLYDSDIFLKDGGEFYTAMRFLPNKKPKIIKKSNLLYGLNPTKEYLFHKKKVYNEIIDALDLAKETESIRLKREETLNHLKLLEEML